MKPDRRVLGAAYYYPALIGLTFAVSSYYYFIGTNYYVDENYTTLMYSGYFLFIAYLVFLLFHKHPIVFDPPILLFLSVLPGAIVKIPFLATDDAAMKLAVHVWDTAMLVDGNLLIAASMVAFLAAYALAGSGRVIGDKPSRVRWNRAALYALSILVVGVTAIATVMTLLEIGFDTLLANPSAKRFLELEGAAGRFGTSLYFYYKIAISAKVVAYAGFAYLLTSPDEKKGKAIYALIFMAFFISILIPYVFNARAQALILMIDAVAMFVLAGKKIRLRYVAAVALAAMALFAVITRTRFGDAEYGNFFTTLLAKRYFLDLMKTTHIYAYFNENGGFFHGETLIGWLFIPVPAAWMPDKPLFLNMGNWIGENLYNNAANSVPPGFVAELYMNFGYAGTIIGMALAGLAIGWFWRWFLRRTDRPAVLLFGSLLSVRFGIFLFNTDFGTFVLKVLIEAVPAIAIVMLVSRARYRSDDRMTAPAHSAPDRPRDSRAAA